nr:amidohydrolase family protein [Mycolicibacterium gilvum]
MADLNQRPEESRQAGRPVLSSRTTRAGYDHAASPDPPGSQPNVTTRSNCNYELKDNLYRIQDVLSSGGRVSLGTDWPAAGYFSTYKPLDSIQIGVTRQLIGDPAAEVLSPADQKLTVEQAVHANTLGAAYQLRLDGLVGSVETGKRADLIVVDRNIFEIDPHDIHSAAVTLTMMDGEIRHRV